MDQQSFEHEMAKAQAMRSAGDRPEYWAGYMRGIRRRYHGENFGTEDEHRLWMSLSDDSDQTRADRGKGYRAGYEVNLPE